MPTPSLSGLVYIDNLVRSVGLLWADLEHTPTPARLPGACVVDPSFPLDVCSAPKRKVTSPRKRVRTGRYPSLTLGRMVDCEGFLETRFAPFLDMDASIKRYLEQPTVIPFTLDGKKRSYTPDTLISYTQGDLEIVEVKPSKKLSNSETLDFYHAVGSTLAQRGVGFRVITEVDLTDNVLASNVRLLDFYRREAMSGDAHAALIAFRDKNDTSHLNRLPLSEKLGLIARGLIKHPLNVNFLGNDFEL